jgi:hypothetical protein
VQDQREKARQRVGTDAPRQPVIHTPARSRSRS